MFTSGNAKNFDIEEWIDLTVVTDCLKLFLRELPDPLVPFAKQEKFINAASKFNIKINDNQAKWH